MTGWVQREAERQEDEYYEQNEPEETPRVCATCGQDESDCPTRSGCFTPKYKNWIPPGVKEENTGCPKCSIWKAAEIGKFCPACGQKH